MRVLHYVLWSIFELFACKWIYVLLIADKTLKSSTNSFVSTWIHNALGTLHLTLWGSHCLEKHTDTTIHRTFPELSVSFWGFIICFFDGARRESACSQMCVERADAWPTAPPKKGEKTVSTNGFLQRLKSLKCDPEQILHDIIFFSCTGIKVNYISLLTGIALWKKVKCLGCWGFYPFYWEEIPQRELHLSLVQTASLM